MIYDTTWSPTPVTIHCFCCHIFKFLFVTKNFYFYFHFSSSPWRRFVFKPKYWAICLNIPVYIFVVFFCLLLHRLAVRISLPFYILESLTLHIGFPVVWTDGPTVTWLPKFLGWIDYHIFLVVGLRSRALRVINFLPLLERLPMTVSSTPSSKDIHMINRWNC